MKQNEYIASLLEKFLEGQSTEAEEQTLSEYFDSADDVPAEWVAYQELFRSFTTDAYVFSNEEIDAMLAPTPSKKGIVVSWLRWSAVACAIIAVLAGTWLYYKDIAPSPTISQKPVITQNEVKKVAEKSEDDKKDTMREQIESPTLLAHKEQQPAMKYRKKAKRIAEKEVKASTSDEVSTTELLETVNVLTTMDAEYASITAKPHKNGFLVNVMCTDGEASSFLLQRSSDGTSLKLTTQLINN
ncbi:MAG: hypothetical protein MR689_01925 [Bacteroidales bacterium]|nr:hypothetical protein [Bacteroidales bacterium]